MKRKHAHYKNIDISCLEEWTKQFDENSDDSNESNDSIDDLVTDETEEQCQEEEKVFNASTCLLPDDPLSDVIGNYVFE